MYERRVARPRPFLFDLPHPPGLPHLAFRRPFRQGLGDVDHVLALAGPTTATATAGRKTPPALAMSLRCSRNCHSATRTGLAAGPTTPPATCSMMAATVTPTTPRG